MKSKLFFVSIVLLLVSCKKKKDYIRLQTNILSSKNTTDLLSAYKKEDVKLSDDKYFRKGGVIMLSENVTLITANKKRGNRILREFQGDSFKFEKNGEELETIVLLDSSIFKLKQKPIEQGFNFIISVINNRAYVYSKSINKLIRID